MLWARAQQHVCSPLFTNVTTDPKEVGKATGLYAVADSNGSAGVVLLTDSIYQIATTKTDASASAVQGCKSCKDVRDPCNPHPVRYLAAPENTWNIHLQAHEDLLLVIHAKDLFSQPDFADERNYYKGSVVFHAPTMSLIVRQTAEVHGMLGGGMAR